MADSLFSPSWYRVADLTPRLRSHVEIHRHHYRDELWYVMEDHASGRFQRFTPAAYQIIGLMDGQRSIQEIFDIAQSRLGTEAPAREEVIRLLSQLHSVDALQADVAPDTAEMLQRFQKRRGGSWKRNLMNPLFMRFSLLDPEWILERFQGVVRPCFSWLGGAVWLLVVGTALFHVGVHWSELTESITDRVLAPTNLIILWLTFPLLKAFHEFGHAFAVKIHGGEVHDMGIMLLVFTPIPYVDASAASGFREKKERILVGAGGMAAELFLASLAFFVWLNVEPGWVRSVAYNVIFIAGVSSLLFNGNPLLRYDAYYMLSDLLEIANLGPRGLAYLKYVIQRYILGMREAEPPSSTPGERVWFVIYSIASWIYRIFICVAIILFIASRFFFVGVLIALWASITMFVWPLVKGLRFLLTAPRLRRSRTRALAASGGLVVVVVVLIGLVPVPLATVTEGVIWMPEQCFVRAGADGFVETLITPVGSEVQSGDVLLECQDPLLPARVRVLEAQLEELQAIYDTQRPEDLVQAEMTKEEIEHVTGQLEDARHRLAELTVRSAAAGRFVVPRARDLPGRFVQRGDLLGYVLNNAVDTARVVVEQADIDLVRHRTRGVRVRFPEDLGRTAPARLLREVPAATDELPGRALTQEGGGPIAVDPRDFFGIKSFQKVFLFDVELPPATDLRGVGCRVHVRFDHGSEPLIRRWYRGVRQLFLKRFNV